MLPAQTKIGVLGLGQIGGSIAMRLSAAEIGLAIHGYDVKPDLITAAIKAGIIDTPADSVESLIDSADVVLLALPVSEILAVMTSHADALRAKTAVTDTGSVKSEIVALADELQLTNFVGGHPLAGTEKQGPDAWNGQLFKEKNFFITPGMSTDTEAIDLVTQFIRSLGAHPVTIEAAEHDRLISLTSNLPHLIAYSLTAMFDNDSAPDSLKSLLRGPSFTGATRVAASDPEMVYQMLRHNKHNLSVRLGELQRMLAEFQESLDRDRRTSIRHFLDC